jgi:hypothetical protein
MGTLSTLSTNVHLVRYQVRYLVRYLVRDGHGQRATGSCGHCPHCPPLKYYTVRIVRLVAVEFCFLLEGPRVGPAAEGHGSGGATNKIF